MASEPTLHKLLKWNYESMNWKSVKNSFQFHYGSQNGCFSAKSSTSSTPKRKRVARCNCVGQLKSDSFFRSFGAFLVELKDLSAEEILGLVETWMPAEGDSRSSYKYQVPFITAPMLVCPLTLANLLPIGVKEKREVLKMLRRDKQSTAGQGTSIFAAPTAQSPPVYQRRLTTLCEHELPFDVPGDSILNVTEQFIYTKTMVENDGKTAFNTCNIQVGPFVLGETDRSAPIHVKNGRYLEIKVVRSAIADCPAEVIGRLEANGGSVPRNSATHSAIADEIGAIRREFGSGRLFTVFYVLLPFSVDEAPYNDEDHFPGCRFIRNGQNGEKGTIIHLQYRSPIVRGDQIQPSNDNMRAQKPETRDSCSEGKPADAGRDAAAAAQYHNSTAKSNSKKRNAPIEFSIASTDNSSPSHSNLQQVLDMLRDSDDGEDDSDQIVNAYM